MQKSNSLKPAIHLQKAIDYWERGVNQPKASYIVALADFFDVSLDYLLGRTDTDPKL